MPNPTTMRSIILLLTIITLFAACKDKSTTCDDDRSLNDRIQGTWTLTEIYNPWTQETRTPNAEEEQTLQFGDSLLIRDFEQNTTTVSYEITEAGDGAWLYSNGASGSLKIDCNVLTIDNTPVDGPKQTYSRLLDE